MSCVKPAQGKHILQQETSFPRYFIQSEIGIHAHCNNLNLICCKTGFNVGSKTPQHRFSTPFSAALQNKLEVFVTRFTVP